MKADDIKDMLKEMKAEGLYTPTHLAGTLLTGEQVMELMKFHARKSPSRGRGKDGSGRQAARTLGMNASYWRAAANGYRHIGDKILDGYHLEKIVVYRLVEDKDGKQG